MSAGSTAQWCGVFLSYILNLCLYDGMLTLVEVNHHALLAEISNDTQTRAHYHSYSSICAALGSLTSLFAHAFYWRNTHDTHAPSQEMYSGLWRFRIFALCVCFACVCMFEYACTGLSHVRQSAVKRKYGYEHTTPQTPPLPSPEDRERNTTPSKAPHANNTTNGLVVRVRQFARELSRQENFRVFAVVSSLQTFDCAFGKNFFTYFLSVFASGVLPHYVHSVVITSSFLMPWIATYFLAR